MMAESSKGVKGDLWGDAFVLDARDSYPITILKEQADALTARTNGLLEGIVTKRIKDEIVWVSLYANAPKLKDYSHKILTISYPVSDDPDNPQHLTIYDDGEELIVDDDFSGWLNGYLSSPKIRAVIINLLRFSKG